MWINAFVLRLVVRVTAFVWPHRLAWLVGTLFVIGTAAAFWGLRLRRRVRRRVAAPE